MLNELAIELHTTAVEKGWWEEDRNFGEVLMLVNTELAEAYEEYRKGREIREVYYEVGPFLGPKPCGISVELVDAMIRILEFGAKHNINWDMVMKLKMEYNKTRPYRHGGLKA